MPKSRAGSSKATGGRTADNTFLSALVMDDIHERTTRQDEEELALKRKLVPRLAKRAYHLEDGNSWCQDWIQYQKNTHPVFGLCLYHRFHPIRWPQRVIILVGSIAFGFAITNCVYLGFLAHENAGDEVNFVYDTAGQLAEYQQQYTNIELQQGVVFLVTVGSSLHSMFDFLLWYLMACFCFRPGGRCQGEGSKVKVFCRTFGIYTAVLVVVAVVVAATSVAIVRLNGNEEVEAESMGEEIAEDQLDGSGESERFSFLVGYALELVFALFIFYFITSTIFFSGILGCGRVPVLGGRPYEIRRGKKESQGDVNEEEYFLGMQAYI